MMNQRRNVAMNGLGKVFALGLLVGLKASWLKTADMS